MPLSSGKIDKYEYITGEEVMPLNVSQIIEHIIFTCFPLRKVSERQKKAINDHGRKLIEALATIKQLTTSKISWILLWQRFLNAEAKDEIEKNKRVEKKLIKDELIYKTGNEKE